MVSYFELRFRILYYLLYSRRESNNYDFHIVGDKFHNCVWFWQWFSASDHIAISIIPTIFFVRFLAKHKNFVRLWILGRYVWVQQKKKKIGSTRITLIDEELQWSPPLVWVIYRIRFSMKTRLWKWKLFFCAMSQISIIYVCADRVIETRMVWRSTLRL